MKGNPMKTTPLFLISGPYGSGKTTVTRTLNRMRGLVPVVSYTTRPMREGEVDGIDHHFVTQEQFDELHKSRRVEAYTSIVRYDYGSTKEAIDEADMYVVDVNGIKDLKWNYKTERPIIVIGILCPADVCGKRMRERGDSDEEIDKRLWINRREFADLPELCNVMLDGRLTRTELAEQVFAVMKGYYSD